MVRISELIHVNKHLEEWLALQKALNKCQRLSARLWRCLELEFSNFYVTGDVSLH